MPRLFKAANVNQAIDIAIDLKNKGQYDWFRGQTTLKPPRSSSFRAYDDPERLEEAKLQYIHFFKWLRDNPQLKHLYTLKHEPMAILQHYGVPTEYIDFTTDPFVAGFFACHTSRPPDGDAVIFCLDSNDVIRFWKNMKSLMQPGMVIEKVEVDVSNLWRLQAQKGKFLRCNFNWDDHYPMDRIVFPRTGLPVNLKPSDIYPEEKSPLEIILDQYFYLNRKTKSIERLVSELKKIPGMTIFDMRAENDGYLNAAFQQEVTVLDSWAVEKIDKWLVEPVESFKIPVKIPIDLKGKLNPREIGVAVADVVTKSMQDFDEIRSNTIEWPISNASSAEAARQISDALRTVWNGLRIYPYTDADIIDAMEVTAALAAESALDSKRSTNEILADYFSNVLRVGFAYGDGSGTCSYTSIDSLHKCLRKDFFKLLVAEHRDKHSVEEIFPIIFRPWRMFEFEAFTEVFAREIIPTQIVFGEDDFIVFNPARLITFGLP